MSKPLSREIKTSVKSGISVPATVVDVFYNKASVKLSGNGALMRNLEIVGGPCSVGDKVKVDFTTPVPTVVAMGQQGLTLEDMQDWLRANSDMAWGSEGLTQITISLYNNGALLAMYPSTATGLGQAITDSVAGDVIWLPDVDLEGDFTLIAGTDLVGISSRQSILRGTLYLEPGCLAENLRVISQIDSAGNSIGIQAQTTGATGEKIRVKRCGVFGFNCGSGAGIGINIADANTMLRVEYSTVEGDSRGGLGYAFSNNGGSAEVSFTHYYYKTEAFHEV